MMIPKKINAMKMRKDEKKLKNRLIHWKKKIKELKLRKEIEQIKEIYLKKLNSLKVSSKIQENIGVIKSEIEHLKKINDEEIRKILGNDLPWKNPITQENVTNDSKDDKKNNFYKIMFWYVDCLELIKIINSDKLKEKWMAT